MYCEVSEGIPNKRKSSARKITKLVKDEDKQKDKEREATERIDIYYFDRSWKLSVGTTTSPY